MWSELVGPEDVGGWRGTQELSALTTSLFPLGLKENGAQRLL